MNYNLVILDILYLAVLPISLLVTVPNLVCIYVFSRIKSKSNIYKYLMANTIAETIHILIIAILPITNCSYICTWSNEHVIVAINYVVTIYLSNVLDLTCSLINTCLTLNRYLKFSGKHENINTKKAFRLAIIMIFIVSLILAMPDLFLKEIVIVDNGKNSSSSNRLAYEIASKKNGIFKFIILTKKYSLISINTLAVTIISVLLIVETRKQANSMITNVSKLSSHAARKLIQHSRSEYENESNDKDTSLNETSLSTAKQLNYLQQTASLKRTDRDTSVESLIVCVLILYLVNQLFYTLFYTRFVVINNPSIQLKYIFSISHMFIVIFRALRLNIYKKFSKSFHNSFNKIFNRNRPQIENASL